MDQEKTYRWVQDRLRELHSGTIAEADRHKLAALAKENPFVADALEGYELNPHVNHAEHLESLAHRIKGVKRERRRWLIPNLTVTAVAASLILIVGFWAVMSRLSSDDQQEEAVAVNEIPLRIDTYSDSITSAAEEDSAIALAESSRASSAQESPTVNVQPSGPYTPQHKSSVQQEKPVETISTDQSEGGMINMAYSEAPADKDEGATQEMPSPPTLDEAEVLTQKPATSKAAYEPWMVANQMDPNVMKSRVTGRITSTLGDPLMGAAIIVRHSNQATMSDDDGKFELYLPKPVSEVDIAYAGYADTSIIMKQGEEDKQIKLNANLMLESVMVGTKGGRSRRLLQDAAPKMDTLTYGIEDNLLFIDYLKKNSKYPLADSTFNSAKMVTLDFLVDSKGKPEQITVYQTSYNPKLDEEAIRLIKKGPDWECLNSNSICRARYSIYFR